MLTRDQRKYFKVLFENATEYIEIRTINNKVEQTFMKYDELLKYQPPMDTNIYVGMFERSRKKGDKNSVKTTNVLYLDFDDVDLDTIMFLIDMKQVPQPTMIVSSGHGYHVYWKLDKPVGHEVEPVLKVLQVKLNADPKAVDVARVLRVPDTMNVKGVPVKAKLIECNMNEYSLQTFEELLGVEAAADLSTGAGVIKELAEIKFNGLNNMAAGVAKGERNFATGRIIQTLRRMNYTKQEATDIVMRWNRLNRPVKDVKELKRDINVFWYEFTDGNRYRYDGKTFSDDKLQELNERFTNDNTTYFNGDETDTHNYDNELLKPENFKNTSGLTFAVLSIIKLSENKGIRREHIADLCKRDKTDKNLRKSLKILEEMKYIKVKKDGRTNLYVFTEKANYRRGYTAVSKSLHRSFIYNELKEHEYKMMILLEWYAFDSKKELYPSNDTLAYRLNRTDRNIRMILKQLEHKQFIVIEYKKGKRFIRLIYR